MSGTDISLDDEIITFDSISATGGHSSTRAMKNIRAAIVARKVTDNLDSDDLNVLQNYNKVTELNPTVCAYALFITGSLTSDNPHDCLEGFSNNRECPAMIREYAALINMAKLRYLDSYVGSKKSDIMIKRTVDSYIRYSHIILKGKNIEQSYDVDEEPLFEDYLGDEF